MLMNSKYIYQTKVSNTKLSMITGHEMFNMYSDTMSLLLGCPACMLGPGPPNTRVTTQVCKDPQNTSSLQTLIFGTEFVKSSFVKTWQILQDNDHSSLQDTHYVDMSEFLFACFCRLLKILFSRQWSGLPGQIYRTGWFMGGGVGLQSSLTSYLTDFYFASRNTTTGEKYRVSVITTAFY